MANVEAWLVRHGTTEWSAAGRHTGRTDVPLTDAGRDDARRLPAVLGGHRFARVLSSPLVRALDTCRLAGFGEQVTVVDDLREWDYGDYEGLTTAQIRAQHPGWTVWQDGCPAGETAAQVATRVDRVVDEVRASSGDVLVFAHGHLLRALAARWLGQPAQCGALYALDPAGVSVLGWEREQPVIRSWNRPA